MTRRVKYRLSFDVTFEGCDRAPMMEDLLDVSVDFDEPDCCVVTRGKVTVELVPPAESPARTSKEEE